MEHLRKLVEVFHEKYPKLKAREELFKHLEDTLLPHLLRVLQKDDTLLAEIELFPGIKVEWEGNDENWRRLHMALVYSVFHGNPKEKFGKILEAVKGALPGGSSQADEVQKILEDEETQSSISEMFELVMSTRLVSLVGDVIQSVSMADIDFNFEDPEQLLAMLRNPQDHPVLNDLMERAKMILEDRIKSGKINQDELRRDIEKIRAKLQSSFGKYLNDALVGEAEGPRTGNTAQQILSSHPDARRARMLARLQRKQQEKVRSSK